MTAHQLARLLLAGPDNNVYLCPTVAPVDAIEQCPGDPFYALDPYITIHSACKYPADHGQTTIPEFSGYCYNHSSYYCGCMKEKTA